MFWIEDKPHVISDFIGKQIFELDLRNYRKQGEIKSGIACAHIVQHIFGSSALVCQKSNRGEGVTSSKTHEAGSSKTLLNYF